MQKRRKKEPYIFQVATKPDKSSYIWAGKELSLLSVVILWTMWLCRFLSIYQHIKAIVRIVGTVIGRNSVDNKSGRPNIPPMLGELYFIVWTTLFALVHIFHWDGWIIRGLMVYYLFESCVWILYYTVFRRFFELGYSIYHKLEYLTAIILILPTQALCFANLYGQSFRAMLLGLLGSAMDSTPFSVALLGCLFAAIVISMIISTFPMEAVKKPDARPNMFVVGCGDVVKKRLSPALEKAGFADRVKLFDLTGAKDKQSDCTYLKTQEDIAWSVDAAVTQNDVIWIETPSNTHVSYLTYFLESRAKLIVMEKPIAVKEEDLQTVEKLVADPKKRSKIFFLSYYTLEKALPLHYLMNFNENYERYLDIEDKRLVQNWRMLLGALRWAEVHICEGEDNRQWVSQGDNGGHLLETFLHNVLIAALVCDKPNTWTNVDYRKESDDEIKLSAMSGQAKVELYQKKNAPISEWCRYANFEFDNGTVRVDMEAQSADIYFKNLDKHSTVSVKRMFDGRYDVMVDMVNAVAQGECSVAQIDGFSEQISTIRWLLELRKNAETRQTDTAK